MKSKKLLSLLLAVIMIMSAVPMFASAAETLSASNVTQWPTISYKNADGKMYYGQTLEEGLIINDDEIVLDAAGNQVAGHFEFVDPTLKQSYATNAKANLIFVPDDTDSYTSFKKNRSSVTYNVEKTTLVLADENNPPIAASTIAEGGTLSSVEIIGGQVKNPYNATETNAASAYWTWVNPETIVTESGEYEARIYTTSSYNEFTTMVYVEVEKSQKATTLKTMPVVNFDYNPDLTWGDYKFADASAVVYGTDTEVPGTFSIINSWSHIVPGAGTYEVEVVFTPDDIENYIGFTTKVPVQINTIPISFGFDFNGTSIDDPFVYEVKPNTQVRDVLSGVKKYLNYPTPSVVGIEDANSYAENGRVYKITVLNYDSTNYTGSEAYVKTVFKDVEFAASSASYYTGTEEIHVTFNSNKAPGAFDVYLDGKLIGDDVKLANDYIDVPYKLETSGKHTVKVVYNPIENDYYFMADYETEIQANVRRYITLKDMSGSQYINVNGKETLPSTAYILYGDEISIKYGFEDLFASWVITDTAGKAVDLGVDLTSSEISFTMPDHDLVIAVKTTLDEEAPDDGAGSDDDTDNGIFGGICSFLQKIINWFINIIKQMMSFLGLGA